MGGLRHKGCVAVAHSLREGYEPSLFRRRSGGALFGRTRYLLLERILLVCTLAWFCFRRNASETATVRLFSIYNAALNVATFSALCCGSCVCVFSFLASH